MSVSANAHSVEYEAMSAIRLAHDAGRRHSPAQIERIARSIEKFGIARPLIVDHEGRLLDGMAVYLALQGLGYEEAPVFRINLPDADLRALRIALNRAA